MKPAHEVAADLRYAAGALLQAADATQRTGKCPKHLVLVAEAFVANALATLQVIEE